MTNEREAANEREAGEALAAARRERRHLTSLPGGLPVDEATAYAIQREAILAYGAERVGYKIGATNPEAQAMLGTDHPFKAPMFKPDCHRSGVTLAEPGYGLIGLEPEFALRLGRDLPARSESYTLEEIRSAVVSVHPAFEVIGLRLPNELFRQAIMVTTDFGANVAFVAAAGISEWTAHDLSEIKVCASVDGEEVANGSGANVLGHPLNALLWLANDLAASDGEMKAGDWISTGTCAGVVKIARGQSAIADFGPIGQVSLSIEA